MYSRAYSALFSRSNAPHTVVVALLASLPAHANDVVDAPVPLPIALLGRLHFPLLHFPIALLFAVLVVELFGGARLEPTARRRVSSLLLSVAAVASVVTAIAGLAYAQGEDFGGREATTFALHRALGLATAVVVVVVAALRRAADATRAAQAYRPVLVLGAVLVVAAGHFGGELVHGEGFLTRPLRAGSEAGNAKSATTTSTEGTDTADAYATENTNDKNDDDDGPASVRTRFPEGPVPEVPQYASDIRPIFERSCVKCHGPEKRKSGLRLDEKRFAFKGGENGPALVPGDVSKSGVYLACSAAPDDDDVMPPRGKLLALSEIETLKRWIEQGAVWPDASSP